MSEFGLKKFGSYINRKVRETAGLELTEVQQIYWRAVQRRMILSRVETLIDDNLTKINREGIKFPYELKVSLVKGEKAIECYLNKFLSDRNIEIASPNTTEMIQFDGRSGSTDNRDYTILLSKRALMDGMECERPLNQDSGMKDEKMIKSDEHLLEGKGGFIEQAWLAFQLFKAKLVEKCKGQCDRVQTDGNQSRITYPTPHSEDEDKLLDEDKPLDYKFYDHEGSSPLNNVKLARLQRYKLLPGRSYRRSIYIVYRIPFVVSNFKYRYITKEKKHGNYEKWKSDQLISMDRHKKMKEMWKKASRWPLFTYWLMFVQTLILIITLSFYGFAPLSYHPFTETALVSAPFLVILQVTQADLSVVVLEKRITPNIWAGPPRDALVLLGANYGPCMRRDQALYDVIEVDRASEASQSGCCVRRDGSGCVQVPSERDCPTRERFADFVFTDPAIDTELYTNRSVCGTSPRTCTSPSPVSSDAWRSALISDWPICLDSSTPPPNSNGTNKHLTCAITGRPCCVGIQALCVITTRENCDFLEGNFHEDAFLCSQVDCLKAVCGLTPFAEPDHPDQVQRLGLALFLHAGIFHLILTLIFDVLILRNLEKYLGWLSTSILYMGSGIGGNIISGIFVPYSPEVGPASSVFGVIAFFIMFILYHWKLLYRPGLELIKYLGILAFLIFVGIFPYVDNYARLGGTLFGMLFSIIHIHHIPKLENTDEFEKFRSKVEGRHYDKKFFRWDRSSVHPTARKVLLAVIGIALIISLYIFSFTWFYTYQSTWSGFTYLNCVIPTSVSDLCVDFGQTIKPRNISNMNSY